MRERSGVAVEPVDTDPRAELRPARPSDEATHRALLIGSQEPRDRPISFHFVHSHPACGDAGGRCLRDTTPAGRIAACIGFDRIDDLFFAIWRRCHGWVLCCPRRAGLHPGTGRSPVHQRRGRLHGSDRLADAAPSLGRHDRRVAALLPSAGSPRRRRQAHRRANPERSSPCQRRGGISRDRRRRHRPLCRYRACRVRGTCESPEPG